MSSQLDVRLGVLTPQIVHLPPDVASLAAAEEAIELADAYGLCDGFPLDESQRFTLRAGLGERADGSWAASTVADFEPRQNGKNDTCNARELAGLILFGEKLLIHTAHEFDTANESFLRMVAIFEAWDDLRRKVARIRYANGVQGIELLSGQRLKYKARTGGSGRGFAKADLVVYDEAQHLQAEHVAASGPARLANPNNQSWYMGSGGLATSANAWRMRRRALAGEGGRFAYVEHTAERVTLEGGKVRSVRPAVLDRDAWALANPAYGRRITDESMLSLYGELGPELFARECECVWDPELGAETDPVMPTWNDGTDMGSLIVGARAFAVDVSPDHKWAAIGAAGMRADGLPHVEVVAHRQGTEWLAARMFELQQKWKPVATVVAAGSPAAASIPELRAAKVRLVEASGGEHAQACGMLFEAAEGGWLRHLGQANLNAAAAGAVQAVAGDTWKWSRLSSSVDICPLVAVTLALWGLQTQKGPAASGLVAVDLDDLED